LRLTYQEYENSSAGIHVEKALHFPTPGTIEVAYRVFLVTPRTGVSPSKAEMKQNFVSALSIPLPVAEDSNSQVCWQAALSAVPASHSSTPKAPADPHCEDIVSDGPPISVPDGVARMELSPPRMHPLVLEWTSGRASIVPRTFSADVNVMVPVPHSSDAPGEFTLRYNVAIGQ
jgi:hypothetical protein